MDDITNTETTQDIWVHDFDTPDVIRFESEVSRLFSEFPSKPIIININSYGGSVHGLFAMLDIMDAYKDIAEEGFCFITYATGVAMSAGAMLLGYGDYRFASPRCTIMLHHIIGGTGWGQSHPDTKVEFYQQDKTDEQIVELIKKTCKIKDREALDRVLDRNLYLTPKESVDFGLIDMIGSPKILEAKVYELQVANAVKLPKKRDKKAKRRKSK